MRTRLLLLLMFLGIAFSIYACSNDCEDDPDCINTPGGWEEIDVEDGHCECA